MVKKVLIPFSLVILAVIVIVFAAGKKNGLKEKKIQIDDHDFVVEIADNNTSREKGLSMRNKLEAKHGMLFIFNTSGTYSFWMKQMKFPLDFIWIREQIVVDLTENVPPPKDFTSDPLDFYTPKTSVDRVLEINAGEIYKLGIKVGDKVVYN